MDFVIEAEPTVVRFWSSKRLAFQPKGPALEARNELKGAIANLKSTGRLHAEFTTTDPSFCDLENVLLYNVGMSAFATIGSDEITLVRKSVEPTSTSKNRRFPYCHTYTTKPTDTSTPSPLLSRQFGLPKKVSVASTWFAARGLGLSGNLLRPTNLGMRVELGLPSTDRRSLHSIMKVLLDGLVSSLHRHDGTHLETVTSRLANALSLPCTALESALMTGSAELGMRALIHPFMQGVQWNPADDIFSYVNLHRTTREAPMCRFDVFEM